MKKLLGATLFSSILVFGASCRKDAGERQEEAAKKVVEEREDLREAQRDVTEAQREDQKKIAEEQEDVQEAQRGMGKDVAEEHEDVAEEAQDLAKAKAEFQRTTQERVARIDQKIDRLESKGDAESQRRASEFRERRDQVNADVSEMRGRTSENWTAFKQDMSNRWNQLEEDIDQAL